MNRPNLPFKHYVDCHDLDDGKGCCSSCHHEDDIVHDEAGRTRYYFCCARSPTAIRGHDNRNWERKLVATALRNKRNKRNDSSNTLRKEST